MISSLLRILKFYIGKSAMMLLAFILFGSHAAISENTPGLSLGSRVAIPLITSNYGGFNIRCFNGSDGFVRVDTAGITGMSGPFSFLWSNGATTFEITNVPAGTYSVVVTGVGGVTQNTSATLIQPVQLFINTILVDTARCNNGPTGKLKVSTSGGISPYAYLWSTGATTDSIFSVPGGNYTVTVTDANGCTAQKIITLPSFPSISLSAVVTGVTCNGGANGSIDLTVNFGVPGFTYQWTRNGIPVGTTQDLSNRTAGTYIVVVTDSKGCTASLTRSIGQPATISLSISTTQPTCNGGSNGIINLTVGGGVALPVASYLWSNGQTTEDLNGVPAGIYTVTVTDANGCTRRQQNIVLAQPTAVIPVAVVTNISCFGQVDGTIDVSVTGGTGPGTYDYLWDFGSTDEDLTGMDAGTYTVLVTDGNNCTGTVSATVIAPALLTLSLTTVNVSCLNGADGGVNLTVSGGTPQFTYSWSNGVTTQNISGVTANNYSVNVTDSRGCTALASATVTQPSTPLIINLVSQTNVNCNGDSTGVVTVAASGGVPPYQSYVWNNGTSGPSITNCPAGTFTVTVTDNNSCSASSSYTITQPPPLTVVPAIIPVNCYGQSNGGVNLSVQGGNPPYQYLWSTGSTSQNLTGVQAGSYSVTITYNQSCQDIFTYQVPQPDSLQITASITNVACRGASTGSIGITVTGGNPSYSYLWSTGAITQFISGLSAGTYTVSVTDSKNCTLIRSFTVIQPATVLSASAASTPETCDQTNGTATVTATGGVPPYTYQWNPTGQTSATATGLDAGTYTVTVTDSFGCSVTAQTTVATGPFPVVISSAIVNVSCFQGNNGAISVVAGGSFPPYTYSWSTGSTNDTITNLTAGTYTVTITDSTGCSNDSSFTITQPSSPVRVNVISKQNVNCFGQSTGSIKVVGTGGTPGYTYQWSTNSTADSIFNLSAGSYTITVRDSNNCNFDTSIVITQNPLLVINAVVQTRPASCGLNNGCARAIVTGGVLPYSYLWSSGATTDTSCGLAPSSIFTVAVTDGEGCTAVNSSGFVSAVPPHSILASASTPPKCHNGTNGSIIITNVINGLPGVGGFIYQWTVSGAPGNILSTTNALNPAGAGTFVVAITDSLNCTVRDTFILTQPPALLLSFTSKNENCNKSDGSATVTASGGTPPYISYNWVNSSGITISTAQAIFNRSADFYTAIVTDNNGCTVSNTVQVLATTPPQIDALATLIQGVNCFGDSTGGIDITPVFGAPPYTYQWTNSSGFVIPSPTTQDIDSLRSGTYLLTLTDSAFCIFNSSLNVGSNPAINVGNFVYSPSTCNSANGCITATGVTGGVPPFNYLWGNGATTAQVCSLAAGVYSLTVSDALGCDFVFQAVLSNLDGPLVSVDSVKATECFGESNGGIFVTVTGNAPFTYIWTNSDGVVVSNQEDLTGFPAGFYCLEVRDVNYCVNTLCDTIVQPAELVLTATVNSASCNLPNGIITVAAVGGVPIPPNNYTYFWPDLNLNASVVSGLNSGVYTCIVTDLSQCKDTSSFVVDQTGVPAVVTASLVIDSANCFGSGDGSVTFILTGGVLPYSYFWPPGSPNASITSDTVVLTQLGAGTYFVPVTDSVGCTYVTGPFIVRGPSQIQSLTGSLSATCGNADGAAWVISSSGGVPGYSYEWVLSGSSTVLSTDDTLLNVTAGTYVLTVTDYSGCTSFLNADIVNLNGPRLDSVITSPVTCFGDEDGSVALYATSVTAPPLTYEWTFQGANPPPGLDTLTGPTASGLIAGIYIITVTDSNDCPLPISLTVTQPGLLTDAPNVLQPNPPYNISCFGYNDGAIQTNVTGGTTPYSYVWSNGDTLPFVDSLYAGIYNLLITDKNGCTYSEIFSLNQPADVLPDPVSGYPGCAGQDTALCGQDLTVTLYACDPLAGVGTWSVISTSGDSVVFQNQNSNTTGVIGLGTGANILQWTVQVTYNQVVCKDSDRVSIFTSDTVIAIGGIDQRVCDGEIRLNATQPAFGTYHWETLPFSDLITFQNSNDPLTDVYGLQYGSNAFVWIVENGSCNDTDTVVVFRNNEFDCLSPIDLPTAFSPNFDGRNDYFIVKGLEDYADNELIIYNRWGQVVYEQSGYSNDWYGVGDNGKPVPDGTYFVVLKIPILDKVFKTYIDLRR